MTNLLEIERWEDGIYQLETSDPVVGGPDGIDNLQAKQLANRTRYLKRATEAGQSNLDAHVAAVDPHPQYATHVDLAEKVAALVAQSPEALDTLSELAKALGNDPNFATTITNALALKAALDSPEFSGAPKAPTPAQFDATTRLATMEAVRRELGSMAGVDQRCTALMADISLPASSVGKILPVGGTTAKVITLPSTVGLPDGASIAFYNQTASAGGVVYTLSGAVGQNIIVSTAFAQTTQLYPGDVVTFSVYAGNWTMSSGVSTIALSRLSSFQGSLGINGYQKYPGGLIEQWGLVSAVNQGVVTITYPLTFPNACLGVVQSIYNDTGGSTDAARRTTSPTPKATMTFRVTNADGGTSVQWRAWGF
ncbi:hypothetical protein L0Z31_21050 (plasmid) [Burkholderia vietnamiensis]|uniref:gp53-like domain-containing protein n=1 Tax=Burkholderia vietnamiensis TaxID=60552 RepID=UPI002018B49C|nr:hypothetical protein [Burkholderia vietnamiensis]MCO1349952.1 hypothetical protein [Burkholderia vietnamiensis]MCO1432422.1 hypothetical protein [Burkholderia vietnamiensis]UQN47415.1 hypothetical protein L0Y95_03865 [Burkholderia vietnamiensis]